MSNPNLDRHLVVTSVLLVFFHVMHEGNALFIKKVLGLRGKSIQQVAGSKGVWMKIFCRG